MGDDVVELTGDSEPLVDHDLSRLFLAATLPPTGPREDRRDHRAGQQRAQDVEDEVALAGSVDEGDRPQEEAARDEQAIDRDGVLGQPASGGNGRAHRPAKRRLGADPPPAAGGTLSP
jgi:hypothetical protein